uniref:Uncharacterized protein n=1 Tax=Oryza nivara TaxID=4536 RepID=A0A0E0JBW5_ORYNI
MEGSRIMPTSSRFDQEAFAEELNRIIGGLAAAGDDDPGAAERRYARLSEADREELRCVRRAFANLDRAPGCRRRGGPRCRIRFRLVGGRLVREEGEEEEEVKGKGKGKHEGVPTANGGVGESPSSSVAAAAGSEEEVEEDELCSAFRSACGASS